MFARSWLCLVALLGLLIIASVATPDAGERALPLGGWAPVEKVVSFAPNMIGD